MNLPSSTPVVSEVSSPAAAFAALAGRLALSLALGLAATIGVAVVWGLLASATDRIFFYAAVLAGVAIGGVMLLPLGQANLLVRIGVLVVAAVLTVVAVVGGDFLYLTLNVADRNNVNLLVAAQIAAPGFVAAEQEDGVVSVIFALLGAVSTFFRRFQQRR